MIPGRAITVVRPPARGFAFDWRELWQHRELLYFFVWRDIKVRYRQTVIGAGWAVLQPVFAMVVFSIFFGRLARVPSEGVPYAVFAYAALLPWTYFATALMNATSAVVDHARVITKVYFPRVLLPAAAVVSGLVDFAAALVVLVALMLGFGIRPTPTLLAFPLFLLLAVATALAAGLWLSALNALYRDVRYAVPVLIQLWLFASPVAYPSSLVPGPWRALYALNPLVGVIDGFRWALLGTRPPSPGALGASVLAIAAILWGGLLYFRRMERYFADVV